MRLLTTAVVDVKTFEKAWTDVVWVLDNLRYSTVVRGVNGSFRRCDFQEGISGH